MNKIENKNDAVAIYHQVYKNEGWEKSSKILLELLQDAQKKVPNKKRILFLEIEGHRTKNNAFDRDMFSLQFDVIIANLSKYLSEVYMPLGNYTNKEEQINEIPGVVVNPRHTDGYYKEHEE